VNIVPYALVYIDEDSIASLNARYGDSFRYADQAITLNRSLLALGLPRLTIATNVPLDIERYLAGFEETLRPELSIIRPSLSLPAGTRFHGAHFKLDLLEQAGRQLQDNTLLLLLDADMFVHWPLDARLLDRCAAAGVGAFDISDQEFSAYGNARVIRDLEKVAGRPLANPRWFGGELLLASAGFIAELIPCARECFHRYVHSLPQLNHHGDEMFMSAALNLLSERGQQIIDVGAYRMVGRHWSGNTHRDLRWFRQCSLLHLPGCKDLLERQAGRNTFSAARLWNVLAVMHSVNRLTWPFRQMVHARRRKKAAIERLEVLLVECNASRLTPLQDVLQSQGISVVYATTCDDALNASIKFSPQVIVIASPLGVPEASDTLDSLHDSTIATRRPVMLARSLDDTRVEWTRWDGWIPRSADTVDVARLVTRFLGKSRRHFPRTVNSRVSPG
jgi:hypothetical protein